MQPDLSLDDVAQALTVLDATDRDAWVKMGMAIKSEFGEAGFGVWDEWSATAGNYQASAAKSTWKSFRQGGRVTIGTLIAAAKAAGHRFTPQSLTEAEKAARRAEQQRRREQLERQALADEVARVAWHKRVAEVCARLDAEHLADSGTSEYLRRKHVGAFGLRFVTHGVVVVTHIVEQRMEIIAGREAVTAFFERRNAGEVDPATTSFRYLKFGTLAVPMRDFDGVLWGFQFINAQGGKQFLKFGRKSALHHLVTSPGAIDPAEVLAAAEGYATAASVHHAMRWPVAVAFDEGNLLPVCAGMRVRHPRARMFVCGDDDRATDGNPGRRSAMRAASSVGGVACLPDFAMVAA